MSSSPWNFQLSELSTLSLQQFINYSSDFPTPAVVPWRFLFMIFCSAKLWLSVTACLFLQFGGCSLLWNLTSLKDLRRVVDFSMSSAFYLLEETGNIQAPNMPDQKLGVMILFFFFSFKPIWGGFLLPNKTIPLQIVNTWVALFH